MEQSGYIGQLGKRWGMGAPKQLLHMFRLHRLPFEVILRNIFEALDAVNGHFAFPTIAAVANMHPELVREIESEGHEVASHGFNHVRYPTLSTEKRERDLALSLSTFKKMGITIDGFRAPYNNYTDDMPALLEKYDLIWDGGFGYRPEHRGRSHFFQVNLSKRPSAVTFIPLNIWSDDLMIDGRGMGPSEVTSTLKKAVLEASKSRGVIMFDLHPIRMGQPKFVGCLRDVSEYAQELGAWCTTPRDAVRYWSIHRRWKSDSSFCLLLTGDIDNWVFSDYLRRVIWKRQQS